MSLPHFLSPLSLAFLLVLSVFLRPVSAYKPLSDHFLKLVPAGNDTDFDIHTGQLLSPLLIPRVPGTPGQAKVQEHFVQYFKTHLPKWEITWQNSTSKVPSATGSGMKDVPFGNLIFKREPPWTKPGQANLLTLAAHYDSKQLPGGDFIGATDSAVPCAVLMHVARSIDKYVTQMHDEMAVLGEGGQLDMDMGVQIVLLDGEEAFKEWSATDSLYGARSLASHWESTPYPPKANFATPLDQITLFLLLDLLGSAHPTIPSYFQSTHWTYRHLSTLESRMRALNLLESRPASPFLPDTSKLSAQFSSGFVQDDHVPFMARGVPVLHVIPSPFPDVWHTLADDGEHLDMPTVRDWARLVTAFALEWLDMMEVEPKEPGAGEG